MSVKTLTNVVTIQELIDSFAKPRDELLVIYLQLGKTYFERPLLARLATVGMET